jgi:hypothetical protein
MIMNEKSLLKLFVENCSLHPSDRLLLIEYVYRCRENSRPIDYEEFERLPSELRRDVVDAVVWIEETIDFLKEKL